MDKNIRLAYILTFLNKAWFWTAIWILYYLRFTDYAGIGIIESVMIVISVVLEIPTGAIADLLGKKKTLIASMFFWFLGNVIMALTPDFSILLFSVFVMTIGGALFSGTFEALVYDSLKENGTETTYDKVISNISSVDSIAMAVCAIIGGFMYAIDPRFPFFASAAAYFLAMILCFFIHEPHIDSEKFSFKNFLVQNKAGFHELVKDKKHRLVTFFLLPIMCIYVFGYQFLQDAIHLDLKFEEKQLGFIFAGICIVSAIFSQFTHKVQKKMSFVSITMVSTFITGAVFITVSLVSPVVAILLSYLRIGTLTIQYNITSQMINKMVDSKNRATSISTFSLITNLPYVIVAFFMGKIIDSSSALTFAFYLGIITISFVGYQVLLFTLNKKFFKDYQRM